MNITWTCPRQRKLAETASTNNLKSSMNIYPVMITTESVQDLLPMVQGHKTHPRMMSADNGNQSAFVSVTSSPNIPSAPHVASVSSVFQHSCVPSVSSVLSSCTVSRILNVPSISGVPKNLSMTSVSCSVPMAPCIHAFTAFRCCHSGFPSIVSVLCFSSVPSVQDCTRS